MATKTLSARPAHATKTPAAGSAAPAGTAFADLSRAGQILGRGDM
jgi:hypothetical protein